MKNGRKPFLTAAMLFDLYGSRPEGWLILLGEKLNSRLLADLKGELQEVIHKYRDVFRKSCYLLASRFL